MVQLNTSLKDQIVESIDTRLRTRALFNVPDIDERIGGVHAHELISISGREGVGKTTFALWCCNEWLKQGKHVMYFTNEQTQSDLLKILAANKFSLDSMLVRDRKLPTGAWEACIRFWEEFPVTKFEILDQKQGALATSIAANYHTTKPDIIVIDNLNQVNPTDPREPRPQLIKRFVEDLHTLCKKNDVAVILLTHLNRAYKQNKSGAPEINNIAESASVQREVHTALLLHWPWYDERDIQTEGLSAEEIDKLELHDEHTYYVKIAKARNGKPGQAKLWVDMKTGFFQGYMSHNSVQDARRTEDEVW